MCDGLPVKTLKENVYRPSIEIILISFHYCDRNAIHMHIGSVAKYLPREGSLNTTARAHTCTLIFIFL